MILGGTILLHFPFTGIFGLWLTLAFLLGKRWYTRIALAMIGAALMLGANVASQEISRRIEGTARVATTSDFEGSNRQISSPVPSPMPRHRYCPGGSGL
ncbi:MAG: hypothetical protein ACK5SX_05770 [Sandaracinobacter sp.]